MSLADTVVVLVVGIVVGGPAVALGVRLVADGTVGVREGVTTTGLGTLAWGAVSLYYPTLPVVGGVVALVAWIAAIALRYPRGWGTASGVGFAAWLASSVALYLLGTLGVVSLSVVGVPAL